MNPKVRLKNIWNEIKNGGIAINLMPAGIVKNSKNLRYKTKTISLFEDE